VATLVRSWNVFHGNTLPPTRRSYLEAMVRLATEDGPDVVCLQEVPVWALPRLERWSGMQAFVGVARRPLVPFGGWITRLHNGLFRSWLAGQANVILAAPRCEVSRHVERQVSEPGRERRICHAIRIEGRRDGMVVGNVHASNDFAHPEVPRAEVARAQHVVDELAGPADVRVLAGDFNLRDPDLPGPNIDHIVVFGARASPLHVWPVERRRHNGLVLSDHAPVEVMIG
jgi:endonuclease/exonuclease/phosphatase family metal-dependent hydrolase